MLICDIKFRYCQSFCFFFQAEDGIRDYKVTGVQTCALPILPDLDFYEPCFGQDVEWIFMHALQQVAARRASTYLRLSTKRSEERRVGKECRCRRAKEN